MAKPSHLKSDYMLKRSQNKNAFLTSENYKSRWFVLDSENLKYSDGSLEKIGKQKGIIPLKNVKGVEILPDKVLEDKDNVFQVIYADGSFFTLYIVASTAEKRKEWVEGIKDAAIQQGATFSAKYHDGVWTRKLGKYSCCDQIARGAPGCKLSTVERETTVVSRRAVPLPPTPSEEEDSKPEERKIFIAIYNFEPVEDGDLELIMGEEYEVLDDSKDHWWKAKDKKRKIGYIPANYVKKKFDLEIYDWYKKNLSRERSEIILREEDKEGCFVVRESSTPGMFTLSLFTKEMNDGLVRHYHIKKSSDSKFYISEKYMFKTIPELINYHKHNSAGLASRLRSPPSKGGRNAPATAGIGHSKYEIDPKDVEILEQLGAGCFGTVHKGRLKGITVAVKQMKEKTMSEESFLEEAKTMTQLNHPNLVQLYGIVTRHRPLIIVTEIMSSGSLLSYLKRHKHRLLTKTASLLDINIQICNGMEYLEKRHFIHRDLAARNCLVGDSNVVKVADFGLARYVIDDEYQSSNGTKFPVKWAPPEVLSYTKFSSKSDVWAFGILMWEVFTGGQMPYDKMKNADVVEFVCNNGGRLEKPSSCPEKIYKVMKQCWEMKPEDRPSFGALLKTLSGLLERGDYPYIGMN